MRIACRCSPFGRGLPSTGSVPPTSGQHSLAASHRALHFTLSPKNSARKTTCSASTVHNTPASAFSLPRDRHTYDFFSVCSVVSDGFRLQTPLLNNRMRYLRGLKPTLRFLDRAIRGHVIPRFSAFFSGQKKHTYAKQPALPPPVHNIPVSNSSLPGHRYSYDFFSVSSVSSVVSDGFRLKTPLLNKCTRNLRGLKPTLRFLDSAIRGHVIPRFSAAKKKTHPRSQNNLLCHPAFTTFPAPLPASPETATPTISFPCLPCLPW